MKTAKNQYMQQAIEEALKGIRAAHGGPFASVIVKNGQVVGKGHNRVLKDHDPTCHGEVSAIREACRQLGTHDLTGCEIYTTGEPCPMCLCACLWANISHIYYGCTLSDNDRIGFRDEKFSHFFKGREQLGQYLEQIDYEACLDLFVTYAAMNHEIY